MTSLGLAVLVVAVGCAAAIGLTCAVIISARSLVTILIRAPHEVTPVEDQARVVARRPVPVGAFEPDLAWPVYPLRQASKDRRGVAGRAFASLRTGASWWARVFLHGDAGPGLAWWLFLPIPLLSLAVLAFALTGTVIIVGTIEVVSLTLTTGTLFAGMVIGLAMRGAEAAWQQLRGAEASCPTCFYVSSRPAYLCPSCSRAHRDVRPSRYGTLWRRCDCGELMPTTVTRSAWRLTAVCQRCEEPLRPGAAAVREIRVPVFGDVGAGKTRFLYAALEGLEHRTQALGMLLSYPDAESKERSKKALELIRSGRDTLKTSDELPRALTCQIGAGLTATLIHLFDAAGERFRDASGHDDLGFLADAHGLVYVIDPFAVPGIRDAVAAEPAALPHLARAAGTDPESGYGEVVTRLRGSGVPARAQRLAIVVSRSDLLRTMLADCPDSGQQAADWLYDKGLHNVVLAAKRDFDEVEYFMVASVAGASAEPGMSALAPLSWLAASRGLQLGEPVPAVGGGQP